MSINKIAPVSSITNFEDQYKGNMAYCEIAVFIELRGNMAYCENPDFIYIVSDPPVSIDIRLTKSKSF